MKTTLLKFSIVILLFVVTFNSAKAQQVSEDAMANLTALLDLSALQQDEVNQLMAKYRGSMDWILTKYEGQAEPDVGAMIGEVRVEREAYRKELQTVLSKNQYETYRSKTDQILTDMFNDLANVRLAVIQPEISLSDKQVLDLTPIIGKSMKQTVQLLFEYAGQKLNLPTKLKIKNSMQKIDKEKRAAMQNILTPSQLKAYDTFKKAQKEARKNA